jgi:hypothetical protein
MLDKVKQLLEITGDEKDEILRHFIRKAKGIIEGYCGIDEIPNKYNTAVIDYAIYLYKHRNEEGLNSITQGSRAVTYLNAIPESIRLALPKPKVKVGS